jgi:uncharacterized membrane protein YraQ (UPF0718 family)
MIVIAVLVAISVALVYRRDGIQGVTEILTSDLALFGGILPRVLAGCLLGAFIAEILPHEKVSRSLGPQSGLKGLLIGTAFGAILPGGPFTAYPVASALLTVGADFGATIAMVVSWTLIGYGRAVAMGFGWRGRIYRPAGGRLVLTSSVREGAMDFIHIVPRVALGVIGSGSPPSSPRKSSPAGSARTAAGSASCRR